MLELGTKEVLVLGEMKTMGLYSPGCINGDDDGGVYDDVYNK